VIRDFPEAGHAGENGRAVALSDVY
jgi:hypothetical protein